MSEPTTERLAQAMEQAGCPANMIALARDGYYDDFKSPLDMPCSQLVEDLRSLGQDALADRAIVGEFDSTTEESEAWFEAEGKQLIGADFADKLRQFNAPKQFLKFKGFGKPR